MPLRIALPVLALAASLAACTADGGTACTEEGGWELSYTIASGSDPLCEPIDSDDLVITGGRVEPTCDAGCTCDSDETGACSGSYQQTCAFEGGETSIDCTYDFGSEQGGGRCTMTLSGAVSITCIYDFDASYVGG